MIGEKNMEASEDLELFINDKQEAARRYRRIFVALDTLSVTLLFYIVLRILNMDLLFSTIYAEKSYSLFVVDIQLSTIMLLLVSFAVSFPAVSLWHRRDKKQNIFGIIETKYPSLEERLRTAYDNRNVRNTIVPGLLTYVVSATAEIHNSAVLNKKTLRFTVLFFLTASLVTTTTTVLEYRSTITPSDIQEVIEALPFIPDNQGNTPITSSVDDGDLSEIMGEPSVSIVEGEEVDLTLPPGSETGFTDTGEEDNPLSEFNPSSSYDMGMMSSSAYYEQLPEGYEDIIKSYFEEITKQ
jgi:hypothetical protein